MNSLRIAGDLFYVLGGGVVLKGVDVVAEHSQGTERCYDSLLRYR